MRNRLVGTTVRPLLASILMLSGGAAWAELKPHSYSFTLANTGTGVGDGRLRFQFDAFPVPGEEYFIDNVTLTCGGAELLVNGDFGTGPAPWVFFTDAPDPRPTIDFESGEAAISFGNDGSNTQLYQKDLVLPAAGTECRLEFDACSTGGEGDSNFGHSFGLKLIKHGGGVNYGLNLSGAPPDPQVSLVSCDAGQFCGDGIVDADVGETCDDGNAVDGDGCDSNCRPTACGNGAVTAGEECDDGNLVSGDGCDDTCARELCLELAPTVPTEVELVGGRPSGPQVVWNGSHHAVFWKQDAGFARDRVSMAVFDRQGQMVLPPRILDTGNGTVVVFDQNVVWTGSEYALAWRDFSLYGNDYLRFLRVDSEGNAIGSQTTVVIGDFSNVRLGWTGSGFGVFFTSRESGILRQYYTHLNATGVPTQSPVVVSAFGRSTKAWSIVWNGSEFALFWDAAASDASSDAPQFARFDTRGQKIGNPVPIESNFDPALTEFGTMIWTGSGYRVTWQVGEDLVAVRLTAEGAEIGRTFPVSHPPEIRIRPDQAFASGNVATTWVTPGPGGDETTYGLILLDEADVPISEFRPIVSSPAPAIHLHTVGSGTGFGVAWTPLELPPKLFFQAWDCCTTLVDGDGDGFIPCHECDDNRADVYPGAPQACDRDNTDCSHPDWPEPPIDEVDLDNDGFTQCEGDCDEDRADVYPGAPQPCDRDNTDCDHPDWPEPPADERDLDSDGFTQCEGDCDDGRLDIFPGAPQVCDGRNNDCLDPVWPALPPGEADPDGDGVALDCDNCPTQPNGPPLFDFEAGRAGWLTMSAGAADTWHLADSSCLGDALPSTMFVSNGNPGPDCVEHTTRERSLLVSPFLSVPTAGPVRLEFDALSFDEAGECSVDPTMLDWKDVGLSVGPDPQEYTILNDCTPLGDGQGNVIAHSFDVSAWAGQEVRVVFYYDTFDLVVGHTFAVDNIRFVSADGDGQQDSDGDNLGDVCDNCPGMTNALQGDLDEDSEGDVCDLDDGMIYVRGAGDASLFWDVETGFDGWNVYRGDLRELLAGGDYTQDPGSNAVAFSFCLLDSPNLNDSADLPPESFAFYLVTGTGSAVESDLGLDSSGAPRVNTNPCP